MRIVYPQNEADNDAIASWVMGKMGRRAARPFKALGLITDEGRLVAGVVFNGYNGANVDLTVYGPGLVTRERLKAIFHYAFERLHATRVTARTRRRNALHSQGLLQRMGFSFETCAARYYGKGRAGDAMVYRMLREQCRWIGDENGRARPARPERNGRRAGDDEQRNRRRAARAEQHQPVYPPG